MLKEPKPVCLKWLKNSCGISVMASFQSGGFNLLVAALHFAIALLLFLAVLL